MRAGPVADPAIIRSLDTGQAAYIYRGGVTFIQIKRLIAAPAALTAEPAADGRPPAATQPAPPAPGTTPPTVRPPDAGALLDEAFGKETG